MTANTVRRRARRTLPRRRPEAWRVLVERYSRYVYGIAVQGFRLPQHEAEDVFQDVFVRAYEHLDSLRDDDALRPWLAQLTRRLCIDSLRGRSREQAPRTSRGARRRGAHRARSTTRSPSTRRWPSCRRTAATSSTASSPATRATGRSATRSSCRPGRSPAASHAASSSFATRYEGRKTVAARLEDRERARLRRGAPGRADRGAAPGPSCVGAGGARSCRPRAVAGRHRRACPGRRRVPAAGHRRPRGRARGGRASSPNRHLVDALRRDVEQL